jgi:hypothetical protein
MKKSPNQKDLEFDVQKLCNFTRIQYSNNYVDYLIQMNRLLDYIPESPKFIKPDIKVVRNKKIVPSVCKLRNPNFSSRRAKND